MTEPVLRMVDITKTFPGVVANKDVDLDLMPGEIHALLGENGAGKTTLMNVVYGLYTADSGEVYVNGEQVKIEDPNDALALGIGMVHQHFMLVPVMTVVENLMLGHETVHGPPLGMLSDLDEELVAADVVELAESHGLTIEPEALVQDLSVGEQQRVEIVKALYRGAEILILDEPTAVLTPQETDGLFEVMHSLIDEGKSIIFITHKLNEVMAIADRITVLRDGVVVGTTTPEETSENELAAMMVGRDVILEVEKGPANPGDVVLDIEELQVMDAREHMVVRGVSLQVRAGEILGLAGVQGNGQSELVEALTGLTSVEGGRIVIAGTDVTGAVPRVVTETGIAHVPADRQKHGLVLTYPIDENLILQTYYQPPFAKNTFLQPAEIEANARELVREYDVRTPSIDTLAGSLSGGNQQKVIVARELSRTAPLLIANQPTRGLDVGSIEYIHSQIVRKRDEGVGVLLVSSELDEIMNVSDRIAVIYEGEIMAVMPADEATKERLGLLMAGVHEGAQPVAAD